jgi:hypothetical protein
VSVCQGVAAGISDFCNFLLEDDLKREAGLEGEFEEGFVRVGTHLEVLILSSRQPVVKMQ